MKTIPSNIHGLLDYLVVVVLLAGPSVLGLDSVGGAPVVVPRLIGGMILLMATFTDYELGVIQKIPMRAHLGADYVLGAFLLIAPWAFGFADGPRAAWGLHLAVGGFVLLAALVSQSATHRRQPQRHLTPHQSH